MAGYQYTLIIGNVGRDPEMRYLQTGVAVCSFSVAVGEQWTDKTTKERKEKTTWFKVTAWRGLAETCNQFVHKGMQIMVAGDVTASAYLSPDGTPKASLDLTAHEVKFLGRRGENGLSGGMPVDEEIPGEYPGEPEDLPF